MPGITWTRSPDVLASAAATYGQRALAAVVALIRSFEPRIETYAKDHAPWTDRTANARQTLFSIDEVAGEIITLYLSHGMPYGKWLELCNAGKYAIVMKTLEAHYGQIKSALDALLRD